MRFGFLGGRHQAPPAMPDRQHRRRAMMADILDAGMGGPPPVPPPQAGPAMAMAGSTVPPPAPPRPIQTGLDAKLARKNAGITPMAPPAIPDAGSAMMPPAPAKPVMPARAAMALQPRKPNTMAFGLSGPSKPAGAVPAAFGSIMGRSKKYK